MMMMMMMKLLLLRSFLLHSFLFASLYRFCPYRRRRRLCLIPSSGTFVPLDDSALFSSFSVCITCLRLKSVRFCFEERRVDYVLIFQKSFQEGEKKEAKTK